MFFFGGGCAILGPLIRTRWRAALISRKIPPAFSSVVFTDCVFGDEGAEALAHAMATNSILETLELQGMNLLGLGLESIFFLHSIHIQ